jgi:hypothetical protein
VPIENCARQACREKNISLRKGKIVKAEMREARPAFKGRSRRRHEITTKLEVESSRKKKL